ncbi:TolC family protein [Kaistella sp. G5-32]|uniref:TolC family protein n=1 Tax=Kaistella gelatinilytica TaxID=2787636 RepID=A0ABS0F925_9FLAO|nr:TolC family protein [Kaistella gelatinilytica]MBF8456182.1 TolC family protein [Kaistella gelatinilytica]
MTDLKNLKKLLTLLIVLVSIGFYHAQNTGTLAYYLEVSQQNNPNLKDFSNQMKITALDSIKMRRDFGFKVNGIADASYSPQVQDWGYNGNSTINGKNLALLGRVSRDIISKKNYESKLNSFSLGIQQLLNQKNLSALNLKKAITEQYLLTYENQEQKKIDAEIIYIFEQEDLILKKLTQNSVFRQTDYLSFKVNSQQIVLTQKQHLADWQHNFALLQYLSGNDETKPSNLEAPTFGLQDTQDFQQSVYAQTLRTDSLKLNNDIQLINYSYQPKIAIFADGGYSSALLQSPYKNFGISAGLSLNIPIYDGHQKELMISQKKIELDTKKNYAAFYEKQYQQQKAQINQQILQYREMVNLATTQMKFSKTLIEANLKQLPTGDVKMVDFILAITNYTSLKSGLLQYKMQVLRLENQLDNMILP